MNTGKQSERLVTVNEAARILGIRPSTVRGWYYKRRLSRVHVGKRAVRIPLSEVNRIIAEGTVERDSEVATAGVL